MDSERRQEYNQLAGDLREFVAENKQWRLTTDEYRKSLCQKIEVVNIRLTDLSNRIYELPCKARIGLYESIKIQLKYIWAIIVAIIGAVIMAFFRKQ